MQQINEKSLKEFLKTLISSFNEYSDILILDYEKNKLSVAEKLLPELSDDERKKLIQNLEEFLKNPKVVKQSIFISSEVVEILKKIADAYEGQGVRIPSLGEKILLALNLYKFLKKRKPKLNITDLGALTGLLADTLYLFWLYKEGFIDTKKVKKYIENLLKAGLTTAENPSWVKENLINFIIPVWAGLGQRVSLVEILAKKSIEIRAEELAKEYLFGSEENYQKTLESVKKIIADFVKEKPQDFQTWLKDKLKENNKEVL